MDYRVFDHLSAEKAPLYRAVLECFARAKEHFVLHLRSVDVAAALDDPTISRDDLDPLLEQLCKWGNLDAFADTSDVQTVEDFYRKRSIYQLSRAGEAAEHALQVFWEDLRRGGELKTAALTDIHDMLRELLILLQETQLDEGKVFRTLSALCQRFEQLTRQAQSFLGGLQRAIDLHSVGVGGFLEYKQRLLDYLRDFIGELVRSTPRIAAIIIDIESRGVEPLLHAAAQRDLVDALVVTDAERCAAVEEWSQRWGGIRSWFMSTTGASQSELLRARARSAIPALLAALSVIHDRRHSRSDRASDFVRLACWFADADSEADAHRLWRAAFGLGSARHLKVDAVTLESREASPVPASASWLDAPPVEISPRLRKSGRVKRTGRPRSVVDRSHERRLLSRLAREEAHEILDAQRLLARDQRLRLSQFEHLPEGAFALFRDLLGRALAQRIGAGDTINATSSDGTLQIELEPIAAAPIATLSTDHGLFRGVDHWILIRATRPPRPRETEPHEAAR